MRIHVVMKTRYIVGKNQIYSNEKYIMQCVDKFVEMRVRQCYNIA